MVFVLLGETLMYKKTSVIPAKAGMTNTQDFIELVEIAKKNELDNVVLMNIALIPLNTHQLPFIACFSVI